MESKALVKLTNNIVACRFFECTPSRIWWIVKICEVVDLFFWEPFWFFLSRLSILGSVPQFFSSLTRSRYWSFFLFSFNFTLWSAETANSTIWQVLFFVDYCKDWLSVWDSMICLYLFTQIVTGILYWNLSHSKSPQISRKPCWQDLEYNDCISCRWLRPTPHTHQRGILGVMLNFIWSWGSNSGEQENVK